MWEQTSSSNSGRLAKQFAIKLSEHISNERQDLASSCDVLLERIAEAVPVKEWDDDPSELVKIAGRMLTRLSLMCDIRKTLLGCSSITESPIELLFALSIGIAAKMRDIAVQFDFGSSYSGDADGELFLRVQPQVTLSGMRVDFLLTLQKIVGTEAPRIFRRQVIVECDGAQFHDAAPEQATRDRRRDRSLATLGLQVLRFSGSELWRDSFDCATQVLDLLIGSVEAQEAAERQQARKPVSSVRGGEKASEASA